MLGFLWRLFRRRRPADSLAGLEPSSVRLIVGLGNPGPEYAETRHNVGFRTVDELARRYGAVWQDRTDTSLRSLVAITQVDDVMPVLAKPQTFMNRSGTAVRALLDELRIPTEQALIVFDDMDLPFGTLRMRERGSPGTHNGMRSVLASVSSDDIPRLRIGISQAASGSATSHVLGEFEAEDRAAVDDLIGRAADAAVSWALDGAPAAMNRYNSVST